MSEYQPAWPDLQLVATVDRDTWEPGDLIRGNLTLTNAATDHTIRFRTGSPAVGALSTLAGVPVGNNDRPHRGAGRAIDLLPGATADIRFLCGSSRLDTSLGTTLPPGDYLVTASLRVHTEHVRGRIAAPAVRIRLEHL